jgi:aminoglycoside 6'-N-acetyltransferase I
MVIQPARKSDKTAWLQMRERLWPASSGEHANEVERYFSGDLREPMEVLLAFDEQGDAIGFLELSIRHYAENCLTDRVAFIEGWYVEPSARRAGVGKALIRAAETWGRTQGCTELGSNTELDNKTSIAAHFALGFGDAGAIRCFKKNL